MSPEAPLPNLQDPEGISEQKFQEIKEIRPHKLDKNRLFDISTVGIRTYTEPQWARILQFDNIVKKVNQIEKWMQYYDCDRLEMTYLKKQYVIDGATVHLMKVGGSILYNSLVAEGLKKEADDIALERNISVPLPPLTT